MPQTKLNFIFTLLLTSVLLQGCLTFRYAVKEVETGNDGAAVTKKEIGVVRVEAPQGQKTACYLTGWIYGGFCWFVGPNEDSERRAVEKANAIKSNPQAKVEVEYLGRD